MWDVKALGTDTIWLSIHDVLYTSREMGRGLRLSVPQFLVYKMGIIDSFIHSPASF